MQNSKTVDFHRPARSGCVHSCLDDAGELTGVNGSDVFEAVDAPELNLDTVNLISWVDF